MSPWIGLWISSSQKTLFNSYRFEPQPILLKLPAQRVVISKPHSTASAAAHKYSILKAANIGKQATEVDAETTPLRDAGHYQYDFNLTEVAEVWRRGSVIASWLLDLTAMALAGDPTLAKSGGRVSDSGEGRWTIKAAIDEGVPAPVLTTALYKRFSSRGQADFSDRLLSAMRYGFGGHLEKATAK